VQLPVPVFMVILEKIYLIKRQQISMKTFTYLLICFVWNVLACTPVDTDKSNTISLFAEETNEARQLPSFSLMNSNNEIININSFNGKKVFVNLWATWCPPCRKEMPSIAKLYQSIDTSKAVFIMVSLDDNFDKARNYVKTQKLNLPIYYPVENLPALFNVSGIPTTFIFNEQGLLVQRVDGGDDFNTAKYKAMLK
jgi:thiol-disulfide isomerase/thioredoxin